MRRWTVLNGKLGQTDGISYDSEPPMYRVWYEDGTSDYVLQSDMKFLPQEVGEGLEKLKNRISVIEDAFDHYCQHGLELKPGETYLGGDISDKEQSTFDELYKTIKRTETV